MAWKVEFFAKKIALWLSQQIVIYPTSKLILEHNLFIQMASLEACIAPMYTASIVNIAATSCHLFIQLIAPPNIMKTYSLVELMLSMSLAQSKFAYVGMKIEHIDT